MLQTEFRFNLVPGALVYEIIITNLEDNTSNEYIVPQSIVNAADANGVVSVPFAALGFTPKMDTLYYAAMYDVTEGPEQVSANSNSITFGYGNPTIRPSLPQDVYVAG